jgi:hypothetical protein
MSTNASLRKTPSGTAHFVWSPRERTTQDANAARIGLEVPSTLEVALSRTSTTRHDGEKPRICLNARRTPSQTDIARESLFFPVCQRCS